MSGGRVLESIVLLPLRFGLGGLMAYAGWIKLQDPQSFAFAIKGYDLFDPATQAHLITLFAFIVPWIEVITGVLLVLGLWTRSAATLLGLSLVGFTGAILSVIARDMDLTCSCFGDADMICSGAIGWCHVGRNAALLAVSGLLVWRGAGVLGLDHPLTSRQLGLARRDLEASTEAAE